MGAIGQPWRCGCRKKHESHKKHGLGDKVVVSVYLYLHPYLGEMIQFDDHIFFQMG